MFKKSVWALAWVAAMVGGTSVQAADADFVLVNRTGYDIEEVYISPTQKDNWGKDRLGEYKLSNGEAKTFRFGDTRNCRQDIRVVFSDDESTAEWEDFNLCELHKITLRYNRKTNQVSAESE